MSDYRRTTRSNKHGKRQKQNKLILFFSSLAILFLIVFGALVLFGNKGNPKEEVTSSEEEVKQNEEQNEQDEEQDTNETDDSDASTDHKPKDKMLELEKKQEIKEKQAEIETKEVSSDDPNVKKAYTGNWKPIGTEQKGEHTTSYDAGSADRVEIKQAVAQAIKSNEDEIIEHWIGRGGEQKVIATVSDSNMDNIHRVYLDWIDGEGWQVTKVEQLNHLP